MKLVFLGTAGYHPNESRHTTCLAIPEAGIVLDAGTGMFRLPQYLQTSSIDILLSHAHLDHVVGLTFLLDILYQHPLSEVRVHGDARKLAAIRQHLFAPELFPVAPPYVEVPLEKMRKVGPAQVTHFPLQHPGGCTGYRIDFANRSLAYITDTTATIDAAYVKAIKGVDLLVHECNFPDGMEEHAERTGHSCLTPVVDVAKKANVGDLVLMHFNPLMQGFPTDLQRVQESFGPIVLAEDGMEIEL